MRNLTLLVLFMLLLINCKEAVKNNSSNIQTYGNSTEYTLLSSEKIDSGRTFEVRFTLDKPAECMTIDIESVYVYKTFPMQRIPERTFFIVEKKLNFPGLKIGKGKDYTQIGRNYNSDWEIYSPVKICSGRNDPLSQLDASEYRIRFTSFVKNHLYYIIKITCEAEAEFIEYTPALKKRG